MAAPVLAVEGLEIKYYTREGVLTAIRNVSFELRPGEILGVVGESGCGKSTVASAVMRLLPPNGAISAGHILLKGRDLCCLSEVELRTIRGQDISMIFQDPMTGLNPVFTIQDQMLALLQAHRSSREQVDRSALVGRALEVLERVGIPDAARRLNDFPHQFSGGMRQRIMIAMALLANPPVLVADEPTSALDVTLEAQIVDLLRGLRDELGTAILYITHDLGVVAQLCDRVLVMYAGNIVEAGETVAIFETPKHSYTQALLRAHPAHSGTASRLRTIRGRVPSLRDLPLGCKFAPRCDLARPLCQTIEPAYSQIGGQTVLCHAYQPLAGGDELVNPDLSALWEEASSRSSLPAPDGEGTLSPASGSSPITVEIQQLSTHFRDRQTLLGQLLRRPVGAVRAVDGVDLQVRRGETLAIVGESGSGKTTLGRTILRLEDPESGHILIRGEDITRMRQSQIRPIRGRMQMIFQDPVSSLNPRLKVAALLLEPFAIHGRAVDRQQKVDELLEMVGLSAEQADKYPHQLSGGQARRVGIARALALHPDILVADEPTSGLDVSVAAGILNLLKDLGEKLDLTYLLITHNLSVVSFIADRVAVMYLGRVVELAETRALFAHPRHPYTEALMSAIPVPDPRLRDKRMRIILKGEIPSPRNPPSGCSFHTRCPYAEARCVVEEPKLRALTADQHLAACHFPERVQA